MYDGVQHLQSLAGRVREQDPQAAAKMWDELEPSLVHMVRRVLRTGEVATQMDRLIQEELNRMPSGGRFLDEPTKEALVRHVARRICGLVIRRLRGQPTAAAFCHDTVRN